MGFYIFDKDGTLTNCEQKKVAEYSDSVLVMLNKVETKLRTSWFEVQCIVSGELIPERKDWAIAIQKQDKRLHGMLFNVLDGDIKNSQEYCIELFKNMCHKEKVFNQFVDWVDSL